MSKYEKLAAYLSGLSVARWQADFAELEVILGFELPQSARKYNAWWANQSGVGHSQTAGWLAAGWKTAELDLVGERVWFIKDNAERPAEKRLASQLPIEDSSHESKGLSIAQAKQALSVYYDTAIANIEIIIRG